MDTEVIRSTSWRSRRTWGARNGIYYYLGGIGSHLSHALPVYKNIGGTFIVTSREAYDFCVKSEVSVVMLDENPTLFLQFEKKDIKRTLDYLNKYARVIVFYEIFSISEWLRAPQIMLAHGVGLKDYYIEWRRAYLKYFAYISGQGSFWEGRILTQGVKKEQIARVSVARMDSALKMKGRIRRLPTAKRLGLNPKKPIVSYMPTWWGPTSVNDTGLTILRTLSEKYSLIFRPHPSTPRELIERYEAIINTEKLNSVYVPDGRFNGVDINSIYKASSAFIVDLSSVSIEALMTDKPIIFAFGGEGRSQEEGVYQPIQEFYESCEHITSQNAYKSTEVIDTALTAREDTDIRDRTKRLFTYSSRGTSTRETVRLIKETAQTFNQSAA